MYCARHPDTDAPWECLRCQTLHCEVCVRKVGLREGSEKYIRACSHCDGTLRVVAVIVPSETDDRRSLVLLPLSPVGLRTIAVMAVLGFLTGIPMPVFDLAFGAVYVTALATTAWHVTEHVARGRAGFPAPVEANGPAPLEQTRAGLTCLLALFFPFGIWWGVHFGAETLGEVFTLHPTEGAVLVALVAIYGPAAILASVIYGGALGAMWPPGWLRVGLRAGSLYPALASRIALGAVLWWSARWALARALGGVPVLGALVVSAAGAFILFASAATLGGFLRRHRDALGLVF